jgi:hypothetical protein
MPGLLQKQNVLQQQIVTGISTTWNGCWLKIKPHETLLFSISRPCSPTQNANKKRKTVVRCPRPVGNMRRVSGRVKESYPLVSSSHSWLPDLFTYVSIVSSHNTAILHFMIVVERVDVSTRVCRWPSSKQVARVVDFVNKSESRARSLGNGSG